MLILVPQLLLSRNVQISAQSDKSIYATPGDAFNAMAHGRWDRARELLNQLTSEGKKVSIYSVQPLCEWAQSSQYNANVLTGLRWCKVYGADFHADDGSVLHTAVVCDKWGAVVERLLQYGCDPNKPWINKKTLNWASTPLFTSIGSGESTVIMNILLKHGASTESLSEEFIDVKGTRIHVTPLMSAAAIKNGAHLKMLIGQNAEVNKQCPEDGRTALQVAARFDCAENISRLLRAGAKKTLRNKAGETALDVAKKYKAKKAITALSRKTPN